MRSMLLYVYGIWINVLGVQYTFSNFCAFGSSFAQLVAVNTHCRGATINMTPFNASLTSNSTRPSSKNEKSELCEMFYCPVPQEPQLQLSSHHIPSQKQVQMSSEPCNQVDPCCNQPDRCNCGGGNREGKRGILL